MRLTPQCRADALFDDIKLELLQINQSIAFQNQKTLILLLNAKKQKVSAKGGIIILKENLHRAKNYANTL